MGCDFDAVLKDKPENQRSRARLYENPEETKVIC